MSKLLSLVLTGTTNGSGAATIDATIGVYGRLYAVQWIDGDFDNGVDGTFTIQNAGGQGVAYTFLTLTDANDDAWYYPRTVVHSEAGVALTGTSGGDRDLFLLDGTPRLVIAQGGSAKTGGAVLYYFDRS